MRLSCSHGKSSVNLPGQQIYDKRIETCETKGIRARWSEPTVRPNPSGAKPSHLQACFYPQRDSRLGHKYSVKSVGRYNSLPSEIIGSVAGLTYCIFPIGSLLG